MAHRQLHTLNDTNNHTGVSGTQDNLVSLDANGLPQDSGSALADIDMQSAYDNDAAILFSKNMSWDLNEAYDFILEEGTDNVTIQATAADTISFGAEVSIFDINTSGAASITSGSTIGLDTTGGGSITVTATGGGKANIDMDADFDVLIDASDAVLIGNFSNLPTATIKASDSGDDVASEIQASVTTGTSASASLYTHATTTGKDTVINIRADNDGAGAGDDSTITIRAEAAGSGVGTTTIDAQTNVNIGTTGTYASIVTVGQSAAGSEIRLVDENHNGSTWSQGYINLSDATADWDSFETNFGEVSLMTAINAAYTGSTLWTTSGATNLTPATAGRGLDIDATATSTIELNAAAASHFTVDSAALTLSTTTSGDIDISAAATLDVDAVDMTIDLTGDLTVGAGKSIKTITMDAQGGSNGGSAYLLLDSDDTPDYTWVKLMSSADVTGNDARLQILASNSGSAAGDDSFAMMYSAALGSGTSYIYIGRDYAGTNHTDNVELDAETAGAINIGANAPVVTVGASSASSEIRLVDENHAGAAPAWTQGYVTLSDAAGDWDDYKSTFGEVSLMAAIVDASASGSNPTLDDAYNNFGGAGTVTIDAGDLTWAASGTNSMLVDLSAATGDADGFFIEDTDNSDYIRATMNNTSSGIDWSAAVNSIDFDSAGAIAIDSAGKGITINAAGMLDGVVDIDAANDITMDSGTAITIDSAGTLSVTGDTSAAFGDDVGTLDFDGSGAVTETGMTDFTITPSDTLTMQGGGVSKFGDDTATLDFDGSGAVTETGMTSFTISPSGEIALTSGDNSNLTMNANDALDKTLTVWATNSGAGEGKLALRGDTVTLGNGGASTIDANSNKITNMDPGTDSTDAVNKAQLDNAVNGLSWQEPAAVLKIKSDADQSGVDPTAGSTGEAWLVNNWATETDGDIVEWDGAAWQTIVANSGGNPPTGTRVVVIDSGAAGSFVGQEEDIGEYDSGWTFTTVANGMAILIDGDGGVYENTGWTYDDTPGQWVQFSGANLYTAGSGISIASQVISLGALTADWAAGNYNITGLAYVEMDELKLAEVAQDAQPTPTAGTAVFWRDTNDSNAMYLVFNSPTAGVVAVEMT